MSSLDHIIQRRVRDVLTTLIQRVPLRKAYLFGSHVEGKADQWSDIDLALFIDQVEIWPLQQRIRFCSTIQKEMGDDLELHLFPASVLDSPDPASFAEYILKHGIAFPV